MNWRLLTAINAAIALVTVCAVIYLVTRSPATQQSRANQRQTASESSAGIKQPEAQERKVHIESVDDLTNARVDDLGAVPAVELTELMRRATPEQLAALAAKFNDAPTDARTLGGMAIFFQNWAELDPKAALIGGFQLNDVTFRKLAATAVVNSASPSAAAELIAYLSEHPDKDLLDECKNRFLNPLISNWSALDPEAASKFMDELGDTKNDLNSTARDSIAYNWGTLDPTAALEWVKKQDGKDFIALNSLYEEVIRGWCFKDIFAASAYVAEHTDNSGAGYAASSVVETMFGRDADNAMNWVTGLPAGTARNQAEHKIATLWADKDPASGARWLGTLPEKEQSNLIENIVPKWIAQNSSEAFRWISTTTGEVHDEAVIAAMNANESYPDSLSLVSQINDPERRNTEIENNIRNWAYNEPQAAEAWVRGSSLSGEQKDHLLSIIAETQKAAEDTSDRVIVN
ncbi:MAG TPA: hypothetical protein VMO75_05275 [Chthoniobacterales bacterium]|nr:hypothetical protein [Chthoniobacterales bacterium]